MHIHCVKCLPQYFSVLGIDKMFEYRINDRDYHIGDILCVEEFDGLNYTGKFKLFVITYILFDNFVGLSKDWCILSLKSIYIEG